MATDIKPFPQKRHGSAQHGSGGKEYAFPRQAFLWLAFLANLIAAFAGIHTLMDGRRSDYTVTVLVHALVMPILSQRIPMPAILMSALACIGVIWGFECIDMCFDLVIMNEAVKPTYTLGGTQLAARELAFLYYNTMLNTAHVNIVLGVCILTFLHGALRGFIYSDRETFRTWTICALMSGIGNSGYLFVIVPRYFRLRAESTFDPNMFDNWAPVIIARFVSFAAMGGTGPFLYFLSKRDFAVQRGIAECEGKAHYN